MDGDIIDSSDVDFEPVPTKRSGKYRGQKGLQFGHDAPSTRAGQKLWVDRFNAYREFTLRKSLAQTFDGEDILRFLDSVIDKLVPNGKVQPGPGVSLLTTTLHIPSDYDLFGRRRESRETDQGVVEAPRLAQLCHHGPHGRMLDLAPPRIWFEELGSNPGPWLDGFPCYGSQPWGVASETSHARTQLYDGDLVMRSEHVELMLEGQELKFQNLRARMKIKAHGADFVDAISDRTAYIIIRELLYESGTLKFIEPRV
ncbi:MAG: hypothetical protein M1816_000169 [Peltula sp. TS41687]|nr:MAG: hypothetical protein M1816_000169 [Peltula sp. TS41687]